MTSGTPIPATPLTDEERCRLGQLYELNHDAVLRQCARVLRDREDAEDACQEVFITASREFVAGRLPENPRGWLLAVARNHCLDVVRRQKRFARILTAMGNSLDDASNPEATVIGRQNVDSVLRGLSPRERQALWQSAVERRTLADIANGLRLNYMAAAQVLSRARRHAAVAMARVAAILFGVRILRGLGRSDGVSRSAILSHSLQLAAVAVVPLVIASTVSSSETVARPAPAVIAPFTAPASILTIASTDHRGVLGATGLSMRRLAGLPNVPVAGSAAIPSVTTPTVDQVKTALLGVARGLPPVPVATVSPSIPPLPKVP